MATAAGIFNQQTTAGQALTGNAATPRASDASGTSSTSSSSDTSSSSATISANDFLTLLVTEMQNQDPTSDTDPNEYINQLVNVNSLEQLIDINQTLSGDSTSSSSGTGTTPVVTRAGTAANQAGAPLSTTSGAAASSAPAAQTAAAQRMSGNLSAPNASPTALRVGHALAGRTNAASVQGNSPANQ